MLFEIDTTRKRETIDITDRVREIVRRSKLESGLCHVMVLHATAAIVVNENDDPNIGVDLLAALSGAVPEHAGWLHDRIDDNAQAHILASILGPSEIVPIENGDLRLGRWQGLMLVELDGPRRARRVSVTLMPATSI
jgi:secondary thiamine-phosphate synthase enzyme